MRRLLLAILMVAGLAMPAAAAITIVGSPTSGTGIVSVTPTLGHMLVATVRNTTKGQDSASVSDNSGVNVWQRATSCSNGAIDDVEIWFALNVATGPYSVSFNNGRTPNIPGTVTEWAGAQGATVMGACGVSTAATTTVLGGIITTPNATDLVVEDWASADASGVQSSRTCVSCTTTPTSWTDIASLTAGPSGDSAYMILTGAGSAQYQITTTTSVNYAAAEAAFAAAPVATPSPTATQTPVPSQTPTVTPTAVPSFTPTVTPTPEPTAIAVGQVYNSQGTNGAPVSVGACSGAATTVLKGSRSRTNWSLLPEGGDIRCTTGTVTNGAPLFAPSATVGFPFKSNILVPETTMNINSDAVSLRLDCCGVAGTVSVDTWEE